MTRAAHADDVQVGAVLRFTEFWTASDGVGKQLLDAPAWGVRVSDNADAYDAYLKVHWLLEDPGECVAHLPYDTCDVVPEDEWPDEVCVALAKWRLTQ